MAQYNADIRVGITGKTQLNALEKQLGRINKDLVKINKGLKAQTLTINTKGATRALDQLDRKINKLNRTINVNANINEKRNTSSSGGGTLFVSNGAAQQLAVAKAAQPIAKALTNEAQDLLDAEVARNKAIGETVELRKKINDQIEKQRKLEKNINTVENSSNEKARTANMNRLFGGNVSKAGNKLSPKQSLALAKQESDRLYASTNRLGKAFRDSRTQVVETSKAYQKLAGDAKRAAAAETKAAASAVKNAAARKRFNKGFGTGAGIAGASSLGGIPVLGDAVTGGLAAGLGKGSIAAGVLGGALVGIGVAAAGAIADVTKFNNELLKQQRALANTVSTSEELEAAFSAIERASDDFLVPIGEATAQFTKLNAAARSSGFTVEEVEEVYRGLAAANTALGGNAERLNGILLATQQVFSKGKVQAEELRGQIGERLAGAFAKFAESAGLSTSELDKALEKGEVSLEDFVKFSKSLLEEYEDEAKKIADAPENAADRLKLAMDDLRRAMGPIVTDIGNMFIEMANTVVAQLTRLFDFINKARTEAARTQAAADRANLQNVRADLQKAQDNVQKNRNPITEFEFNRQSRAVALAMENVRGSAKVLNDITKLSLDATADPLKPRTTLDPLNTDKSKGGSGGSGSGPRSTLAETLKDIELQKKLLAIEQERTGLIGQNNQLAEFALQQKELEAQLVRDLAGVDDDNLDAASKKAEKILLQVKYQTDLVRLTNEQKAAELELIQAFDSQLADLENQIALEEAVTEEKKNQLRLEQALRAIDDTDFSPEQKQQLKEAERLLAVARDGNQGVSGYMKQLQSELMDTETMIVSLAQTVETEIGSAMSSAITGLIDGTKTAQEAFADMFANIGKAFIDMATQMIAKALVMKALGILLPGAGATGGLGSGASAPLTGGLDFSGAFSSGGFGIGGFANGGQPPTNVPSVVGENGPELFVPNQSGRVIPNSAMNNYMPGGSGGGGGNVMVNYSGPQLNFNGDEYLPKSAVGEIIDQAALKGAKLGEARTVSNLRNNRSTRTRAGV